MLYNIWIYATTYRFHTYLCCRYPEINNLFTLNGLIPKD